MIRGTPSLLGTPAIPFANPFSSGPGRWTQVCKAIRCQKIDNKDTQGRKWQAFLAATLIATSVGAAVPDAIMPRGHAEESAVERRRAEANRRKEMLSKTRENALKKGGIDGGGPDEPAAAPSIEQAPPVNAAVSEADKAVEESNQNRSAMSSSMLERLKKASADYEKQAGAGLSKPKDAPNPELPSWLKDKIQKSEGEQEGSPAPAPQPAGAPQQPLKYDTPAPPSAPSTPQKQPEPSIPTPAKVDSTPVQPLKSVTPPPPPPAPTPAPSPAPQAAPAPAPASKEQGFDFGSYFKDSTATPSKEEAKPKAPAPQTVIKASLLQKDEPKEAVKQAAPAAVKPGKRKGPLPLWLAEIIVILGLGGIVYSSARWANEIEKLWKKASGQLEALYNKIDQRQTSGQ